MNSIMLVLALGIAAPAPKEAPKKAAAPQSIIGAWTVESCTVGGKDDPRCPGDSWEFTSDGQVKMQVPKKKVTTEGYKIDDTKGPAEFDLIPKAKGLAVTFKGIYKIDGDTLTISVCVDVAGKRATKFESDPGTETMVWKLKHVAKKKK